MDVTGIDLLIFVHLTFSVIYFKHFEEQMCKEIEHVLFRISHVEYRMHVHMNA